MCSTWTSSQSLASQRSQPSPPLEGLVIPHPKMCTSDHILRWIPRAASLLLCLLFWQLAASHHWNLGLVTFANVPTPLGGH